MIVTLAALFIEVVLVGIKCVSRNTVFEPDRLAGSRDKIDSGSVMKRLGNKNMY